DPGDAGETGGDELPVGRLELGIGHRATIELEEAPMCLRGHLRKGRVIEDPGEPIEKPLAVLQRRPLERAAAPERTGEGVEVAFDRELAVDQRLAPIERSPEVVHVRRMDTGLLREEKGARRRAD